MEVVVVVQPRMDADGRGRRNLDSEQEHSDVGCAVQNPPSKTMIPAMVSGVETCIYWFTPA